MDTNGNFVIVWLDVRHGNADIYFQRYDSSGAKLGNNQRANDESESVGQGPAIAMNASGNFVIALGYRPNSSEHTDIYFQRYDSVGGRRGNNQKVNEDSELGGQAPKIAMDHGGNFVIVWDDLRDESNDVYFQRYYASGVRQGDNQKASDVVGREHEGDPDIAMDASGNFVIVWSDSRNSNGDIYIQRYEFSGVRQGNNQRVNDDWGSAWQRFPDIAMEASSNFVIVWQDYRYDALASDIIGQRYYPDGARRGGNYRIVADGPLKLEERPVVTANSQQMVFAWVDYWRPAKASDIFAKIATWDWEGVTAIDDQRQSSEDFCLFQNYPNPFNSNTFIKFTLLQASFVTLKIYDLLGNEVATLVAEKLPAGTHQRMWEAKGLASEVYLYRIEAGEFVQSRKLVLLR